MIFQFFKKVDAILFLSNLTGTNSFSEFLKLKKLNSREFLSNKLKKKKEIKVYQSDNSLIRKNLKFSFEINDEPQK